MLLRFGLITTLLLHLTLIRTYAQTDNEPAKEPQDGDIKLQRFDWNYVEGTGNVMVYHDGEWGYVCDDGWNMDTAHVVCHSLGYNLALGYTALSYFGQPRNMRLWLDNVRCYGDEQYLLDCEHHDWGENDCDHREAAGVFCAPLPSGQTPKLRRNRPVKKTTPTTTTTTSTTTTTTTTKPFVRVVGSELLDAYIQGEEPVDIFLPSVVDKKQNDVLKASMQLEKEHATDPHTAHFPQPYGIRLVGGRDDDEGRVEVNVNGQWGVICSDHWSLLEAKVACSQLGRGYARTAMRGGFFEGEDKIKMAAGIHCDGSEGALHECYHTEFKHHVTCENPEYVAGVVCTTTLPDLVPNATLLQQSAYLEDKALYYLTCAMEENCASTTAYLVKRFYTVLPDLVPNATLYQDSTYLEDVPMLNLQCAMEENCASSSAYRIKATRNELPDLVPNATLVQSSAFLHDMPMAYLQCALEERCASASAYKIQRENNDWHVHRRRLLRFSSSTWNFGTADFRPLRGKHDWEWHQCHMHYHSMGVFASYDVLDHHGNRVAEGHKASFCLEDVQCSTGVSKKYACKGYGDQGISVGCADDYLHDIDCQWIDITDLAFGSYIFKVHVNPGYLVAELRYDNNAVTCDMDYTGMAVHITNCQLGEG